MRFVCLDIYIYIYIYIYIMQHIYIYIYTHICIIYIYIYTYIHINHYKYEAPSLASLWPLLLRVSARVLVGGRRMHVDVVLYVSWFMV